MSDKSDIKTLTGILILSWATHFASAASIGCGKQAPAYQPNLTRHKRIVGGTEARPHSWPWAIFLYVDIGHNRINLCGASLLRARNNVEESDIVLTTAHCVTRSDTQATSPKLYDLDSIHVLAGAHRRENDVDGIQIRNAAKVIIRSDFRSVNSATVGNVNDLAVVKLDKPIAFTDTIRPVCLPSQGEGIPVGKTCVASGWGHVNNDETTDSGFPNALQQIVLPVHDAKTCSEAWGPKYKEAQHICAGSMKGESGICGGDSGGMLACLEKDGSWKLYGTPSFTTGDGKCLLAGKPAVITRISNYAWWINDQINSLTTLR